MSKQFYMKEKRKNSIEEMGEFVQVEFSQIRFHCPVNSIAEIREQKMILDRKYQRLLYQDHTPADVLEKVQTKKSFDFRAGAASSESNLTVAGVNNRKEKEIGPKKKEELHLSDSGFESKDSDKMKLTPRRPARGSTVLHLGDTRNSSLGPKLEFPEPKFRNFTNIFGKKLVRKSSKPERVTLQSIMRTNWNSKIN